MNKIKFVTLSFYILLFSGFLEADGQSLVEKEVDPIFKHAIGAGAGFTTGYGISYRYMPNKYGFQLNFAPYHDKIIDRYSIGFTVLYTIIKNKISSLYLYQGNHYYYNSELVDKFSLDPNKPYDPNPVKERVKTSYMNNGIGFGIELIIAKRIGFNLMTGYASYRNFEELNLTGETALYYKF